MSNLIFTNSPQKATVITHSGVFHADDVFSCMLLKKLFNTIIVHRTSDYKEELSNPNAIVFDIGGGKFDHHQTVGSKKRNNGVRYSSFGLLWKEYGIQLLKGYNNPYKIWASVDFELVQGIDAHDNGQIPSDLFTCPLLRISTIISLFNPLCCNSVKESNKQFALAVDFAENIFDKVLNKIVFKYESKDILDEAINKSDGKILILDNCINWKKHLLNSNCPKAKSILFIIYPSSRDSYNVAPVPIAYNSSEYRKPLPDEWIGLYGDDFVKVTGIKKAKFCHKSAFVCSAYTLEDAINLANLAIEN